MRHVVRFAAVLAIALMLAPALHAATWTGWITDEHCGAKGAKAAHKSCAMRCHDGGEALVFYNTADEKIYKIDNQKLAEEHLGQEVEVTGTAEGDTITVEAITDVVAD